MITATRLSDRLRTALHWLRSAGDVEGHPFHGNQWTDSSSGSAGPVNVYHGTSVEAAREIKANGIQLTKNYDQRGRPQSVYVTDSYQKALYYAEWKGLSRGADGFFHGDVAIVKLAIPKETWNKIAIEDDQEDRAFRFEQDVPPEWVKGVDVVTDKGALKALAESDAHTAYVVIVCDAARALGGPGSGNFGHAGRPGEIGGSGEGAPKDTATLIDKLKAKGGFTFNAYTGEEQVHGMLVGAHPDRTQILNVQDMSLVTLAQFVEKNWDLLSQPDNLLGGWLNTENGKVYLDVSTVRTKRADADALARQHHEIAYYDLDAGEEVRINYDQEQAHRRSASGRDAEEWRPDARTTDRNDAQDDGSGTDARGDRAGQGDLRDAAEAVAFRALVHARAQFDAVTDTASFVRALAAQLPAWKRLHAAADKFESAFDSHFQSAFDAGRAAMVGRSMLEVLLAHGHQATEVAMDRCVVALRKALAPGLEALLLDTLAAGGTAAAATLRAQTGLRTLAPKKPAQKPIADIRVEFDRQNPAAIAWAKEHAAELIDSVTRTTAENIREAITAAMEGDITIEDATDFIAESVGDPARARTIARTETMKAASEGQRQMWDQAVDDGLLTGNERRVWIITPIEACDLCQELDGEEADLDGQYPGDGGDGPPLHPNCRCTEGIIGVGEN